MATSNLLLFLFLAAFISCTAANPNQFRYWSKHVANDMPSTLLEKLSPLTEQDTEYFDNILLAHLLPKYRSIFCNKADLACFEHNPPPIDAKVKYDKGGSPENVDPCFFFRLSNLKPENQVCLSNIEDEFPKNSFLPQKLASKIPFSAREADKLLQIFPNYTAAIQNSLYLCSNPVKGEVSTCAISLEDMIDFAERVLTPAYKRALMENMGRFRSKAAIDGSKHVKSLMTANTIGSGNKVVINGVKELDANKIVICHPLVLPFTGYSCHFIEKSRIYKVDVSDLNGKTNTVMALCHFDTSLWTPDHPSFEILNFSPGDGEICHWTSTSDIAWINA